ncbi:MAG: LTA synthase family protein, partial [Prevotella sp.]|nr:LTA synthase family protein [Prevotella sp.]
MLRNVRFLLGTFLWTLLVFVLGKVAFMFYCREDHPFAVADLLQVVCHGMTLDLSMSLYIVALPLLMVMVSVWWWHKSLTWVLRFYFAVVSFAIALALVADASLYPFWNFKLDASCLQYLDTPTDAMASVSTGFLLLRLVAVLLLTAVIFAGYLFILRLHSPCSKSRVGWTLFYLLCLPLMVIGIRGGLDESTTNVGQVYFSQNQFLNHAAVNPVFSFIASLESTASEDVVYSFYDQEELAQLT